MKTEKPNLISFIYQFRNKITAIFGDDPAFTIYEINEPLPDGTIEYREDGSTLNIVSTDMAKLTILRDHLGEIFEDGETLYIDYYYTKENKTFLYANDRPAFNNGLNTKLDIALLFEGNPHFTKMYSGSDAFGSWFCIAFKPELIQYFNDNTTSLHGRRSCAMEDIAREVFPDESHERIYFSTENKEDFGIISKPMTVSFKDFNSILF